MARSSFLHPEILDSKDGDPLHLCESDTDMKREKNGQNDVGAVMVVGGGIAGIQASLDLADLGYYVYLVEKGASIGGVMAQLDKTFPTNDCSI
jgi:heterodisulfide reductase subunit A-like polyferredoxin